MGVVDRRIGALFACFLVLLSLAFARSLWLGVVKGDSLAQAAVTQQVATVDVPARRGPIVDRRGIELAVSEPADDVTATPYLVDHPHAVAQRIAPLLGADEEDLIRELTREDTGFVVLARKVPAAVADEIEALGIEGIDLLPGSKRVYPRDFLASQVLGMVGRADDAASDVGRAGLEYAFDDELRGTDGKRRIVRDALGEPIEIQDIRSPEAGKTLELTLDAAIQDKVESVLADVGAKYSPKGATAVVMDPRTSEILAMANWPRVDANRPGEAPDYARQNRAVGHTYEPGSTFKAFTVAGALEDGKVTPDTSFDLPPQIQVADRTIGESHDRGPITLTTSGILAQSSNVGSIMIGQRLGKQRFDHWVRSFGFGDTTGSELPGEERGIVLPVEEYSGSSMGNLPIGQGISVTPLQMTAAYAAIAGDGVLRTPHIVKEIGGEPAEREKGTRVISEKTAKQVRSMLEGVFAPGGTASEVAIEGYELGGKTGTANKVDPETGEYSQSRYVASFVGFAPAKKPEVLVSIMVDEPQGAIYGGDVAAPAFEKIAAFALSYLRIPPR